MINCSGLAYLIDSLFPFSRTGNRTSLNNPTTGQTSYAYNQANQLISSTNNGTTTDYSYDANGAITSKTTGSDTTSYSYNGMDKLTAVATPASTVNYAYDALGRRVQRTEGSDTRNIHLNAKSDLPDYWSDASGSVTASLLRGADGLISFTLDPVSNPNLSYQLYSPHGDTTMIMDTSGNPFFTARYDAFGDAISGAGLWYGYTGKYQRYSDSSTGTIEMGVREYDPSLGRFISQDPLKGTATDPQQRNRYQYVGNDPLTRYDLSGMMWGVDDALGWAEDRATDVAEGWRITMNDPSAYASGVGDMLHPRNAVVVVRIFSGYNQFESMVNAKSPSEAFMHGTFWATDIIGIFGAGKLITAGEGCISEAIAGDAINVTDTTFGTKIEGQLAKRGWTKQLAQSTIENPVRTVPTRDLRYLSDGGRLDEPATAYYSRRGGYIVRNDRTGDIVQVSDRTNSAWRAPWDH
ncbi:MAG: hypothetical protein M1539_04400 [Actinobacteria bacterium]|nr:hypothetical protein [Actinomycetota bacterium]MCL5883199.1 hypothetical protein [Actinomycetota bacterium]